MMKQMRENTKWIMLVTALAFVALMVFEWGMDASGRSGMGVGQIGSVNGEAVMYEEWMATYRNLYDQAQQQQEQPVTSQQNEQLEDQAWDEIVTQILIRQELDDRGIRVTDQEVQQAARSSPPPQLRQAPAFQDSIGRFDIQLYRDFLATSADNQLLLQLEQYYRDVIPRSKLMRQVTTGVYPSDSELWQIYRDRNDRVRIQLASVGAAERIPDSEVPVTEAEVEEFYQENREEFRVPAQAELLVAALPKAPTAADTAAAMEEARELRQEIVEGGAEFAEVARRESVDQSNAQDGGDLGTFQRGQMVADFEEAVFSAEEGEITEPVQTRFGVHLIRVRELWADSAAASHILLPIERTDDSELELLTHADSLEAMTETMPLEEAASNLGVQVRSVTATEDLPVAPEAGRIEEGFSWAAGDESAPGDVSVVFENDVSFYAVQLLDFRPEGYQSVEEVEDVIRLRLRTRKQVDLLVERLRQVSEAARAAGSLDSVAEEHNLDVQEPTPFTRLGSIAGVGRVPEIIGTAFGLEEGEISDPVATDDAVHLVEVIERMPADSTAWLAQLQPQREQVVGQIQQQRLQSWLEGLRAQADIRDRRDAVLQRAEDQENQAPPVGGLGF